MLKLTMFASTVAIALVALASLINELPVFILPVLGAIALIALCIVIAMFTEPGHNSGTQPDDSNWRHW